MAPGRISRARECPPGRARSWRREEDVRGRRGDGEGVRPHGFGVLRVRRRANPWASLAQARSLGRPSCDHNHLDFATPSHPRKLFKGSHAAEFRFWPAGRGRSAAAGAAVRRRRGPTAAGRRIRGLRRCRGRRVVRCSALRSWLEELRSLPRSSVVARRRARGRARAVYNGAGAAGGGRRGEPPPRRRRLSGVSGGPRWAAPLAAFVGTRWLETSRSGTCASQIALRRKARAPRRPGVRNCGGGGGGDLPARPSRREGRRLRARRAVWRRQGRVGPSASVSALAASAPSGAARALGRLAPHKLRAKSVSTSARVL